MERLKSITIIFLLAIGLLASAAPPLCFANRSSEAKPASVLLQEGLYAEETEGDLDAAIKIYERVLKDFPKNRPVAAKALLHIGLCYEKLGVTEAREAYERLLREYADQHEAVSSARARLTALGQQEGEEGPILRRVYSGYIGYPGSLSHDGKLATITDWDTGDLAVRELTSGEVRRLTKKGPWSESNAMADQSIFSPDDKQIAYVWYTHERGVQLRIISADGTGQRILYPRDEESKKDGAFLWPIDWSLDGERILCTWHKKGHKNRVMLLSVGDGSLRELELPEREKLELEEGKPMGDFSSAKFSPDGRHLTLDGRPAKGAGRDVFLLSLEDGSRTPLVEHPADDYLLGWSPDGNCLVFASDRTGDPGIWVVRVDQGKPVGKPMLVKTQMGDFGRVGMMRDGAYYFTTGSGERRNVFTAGLDPETGKVTTVSKALLPDAELTRSMADWLGGADEIAYLEWGDEEGIKIRKIMVHSLKTGATREVITKPKIKGYNINSLAVCPTGKWLAVWGYIEDTLKWRVLLIDLETNELTEVKQPGNFVNIHWSKDGRWLYFGGFLPDESRSALFQRDMQTGKVTELFKPPSSFYSWKISPDEKQIAYSDWETDEIKVIPVTGGEPRVVAKVKDAKNGGLKFWTPDGRYLVYVQRGQLWRVAVEGGEPEAISRGMPGIRYVQIHPDGKRILFIGRRHPSKYELWAMENFLPKPEKPSGMVVRQVLDYARMGGRGNMGRPSPDGRYLLYADMNSINVCALEFATKKTNLITKEKVPSAISDNPSKKPIEFHWGGSIWSPDGKKVAYSWRKFKNVFVFKDAWDEKRNLKDSFKELRTTGFDGSNTRVLYSDDNLAKVNPLDWSSDGKHILAEFIRKNKTRQLVMVSVADGSIRVLKTFDKLPRGDGLRIGDLFSPDGRHVVFDSWQKSSSKRDIHILSTNGSREAVLVEHPADDFVLGWTPDGKCLIFASDRTGNMSIWAIRVSEGRPQGDTVLIKKDMGNIWPKGFDKNGSFYYASETMVSDVYMAEMDSETRKVLSEPKRMSERFVGSAMYPDWSPDGKYLAYISYTETAEQYFSNPVLCIRSLENGEERGIYPELGYIGGTCWSPDGRSILTVGKKEGRKGFYKIDVKTGEFTSILQFGQGQAVGVPVWSRDGRKLFYMHADPQKETASIMMYDLASKKKKEIHRDNFRPDRGRHPFFAAELALSPDGQFLAFNVHDRGQTILKIIPVSGGQAREVVRWHGGKIITTVDWTPDGKELLFAESKFQRGHKFNFWRISMEGGEPQELGLPMDRVYFLRIHPDGQHIAFRAGQRIQEIYAMENFLPELNDSQ